MTSRSNEIFRYCFGCGCDDIPSRIIITPVFPVKKFKDFCDNIDIFNGRVYSAGIACRHGRKAGIIYSGVGDRLLGDAMLMLGVSACSEAVFAGTCGGLGLCGVGDIVLAGEVFNGEGFSRYVLSPGEVENVVEKEAKISLSGDIARSLSGILSSSANADTKVLRGTVYTIGSLMAETPKTLEIMNENNITAIDMELSAASSAAAASGIKAGALLAVSDLPGKKELWKKFTDEEKKKYNNGVNLMIKAAMDFCFRD